MKYKKHVHELCATPATCLHLTESLKGSGQTVVADSWFGSIKSAVQLINQNGLNSIMLVKTTYKNYPVDMLNESQLAQGKWIALQTKKKDVKLHTVKFLNLKEKQFVSTCSITLPGPPRKTKYCGEIICPTVAYEYLQPAASIDIHNHVHKASVGFEDV